MFGRLRSLPDPRDAAYPVRALLAATPSPRVSRYWHQGGWWGDQGATSQCVAYSLVHWLEDGPVTQRAGPPPIVDPVVLYAEAQRLDEYPGEDYAGTSVRGGAKALQRRGFIRSYHWASTVDEIAEAILELGPVVVGTDWYADMMRPDPDDGLLSRTGGIAGGHAYVLNGHTRRTRLFRVKNSWGRGWSQHGNAWLHQDDLEQLLADQGEALLALETTPTA